MAKNPSFHKRSKHIAILYHFIEERIEMGEKDREIVKTMSMAAEELTKRMGVKLLDIVFDGND